MNTVILADRYAYRSPTHTSERYVCTIDVRLHLVVCTKAVLRRPMLHVGTRQSDSMHFPAVSRPTTLISVFIVTSNYLPFRSGCVCVMESTGQRRSWPKAPANIAGLGQELELDPQHFGHGIE